MSQQLPVSKPYAQVEVNSLVALAAQSLAPYYVDLAACGPGLGSSMERLQALGGNLLLGVTKVCVLAC